MGDRFMVREIDRSAALDMVRRWHYSDTLPRINRHFIGCFENGVLVGVVTLGYGTRPRHTIQALFPSLDTPDYLEIGRMCMTDDMPRNSESQMLSLTAKWLRSNEPNVKVLFTWADGIMGKPGYVYQACSFLYAGRIESEIYERNGTKIHPRGIKSLVCDTPSADKRKTVRPSRQQMRELGIEHYKGFQFRYLRFLCGKREKRRLIAECTVPLSRDYPKAQDLAWRHYNLQEGRWVPCDKPNVLTDQHNRAPQCGQLTLFEGVDA